MKNKVTLINEKCLLIEWAQILIAMNFVVDDNTKSVKYTKIIDFSNSFGRINKNNP